jgi:hypothetical protein
MKTTAALSVVLALLATPALARTHHQTHHQQPNSPAYENIDSGYGPPSNWNEIEQSVGTVG